MMVTEPCGSTIGATWLGWNPPTIFEASMNFPDLPQVPFPWEPGADLNVSRKLLRLAHALEMTLAEVVLSLRSFEIARTELAAIAPPEWYLDEPEVYASLEPVRLALDAREPRPRIYYEAAPHLHARTFVLSLRMIGLYLKTMAYEAGPTYPELDEIAQEFEARFPGLKELRDSITHAEDRLRHLDRKGKTIIPEPVPALTEGGGVFFAGLLNGQSLGWTLGDGSYAECAVSAASAVVAIQSVQDAMSVLAKPATGVEPAS
jgi:hypothetical protein